ncbi:monocarboxylate transporter 5-like [Lineus longissimus]|uniref:monocarboxylate transporter 5-like n=1 Tax=Lineus longissimus TaxID=88925 RepID=UPI00315C95C5
MIIVDRIRAKLDSYSPDTRGWLICAAVLMITVVRSGITYSFGEFVVQLQKTYHRPMAEQNWIGTLSFTVSLTSAPLSVALIRLLGFNGYRKVALSGVLILSVSCLASSFVSKLEWMFLTHSILYGIGSSMLLMSSSLVIGEYFDKEHKHHVLATSILLCGYPVGSLVFNPINAWLVSTYGWRVGFRATSILIFITGMSCCFSFVSKKTREELEASEKAAGKITISCGGAKELRARPEILLWLFGNTLGYIGFYMPFLNLAYYMKLKGILTTDGSWALTLLSLFECISYIGASLLGDRLKGKLIYANVIASCSLAVICLIWPSVDVNYALILVIAGAMGVFLGLNIVYTYAASGEVTGLPIHIAWAATNVWSGMGILTGPLFSGMVYDLRHNYDDVFYVSGGVYAIDAVLFCAIPIVRRFRSGKAVSEYDELDGSVEQNNFQQREYPQPDHYANQFPKTDNFEKAFIPNSVSGSDFAPGYDSAGDTIRAYESEFRNVKKTLSKQGLVKNENDPILSSPE